MFVVAGSMIGVSGAEDGSTTAFDYSVWKSINEEACVLEMTRTPTVLTMWYDSLRRSV